MVTGAGRGIGRATALAFAEAGASVAVWERDEDAGRSIVADVAKISAGELVAVDLSQADAVERARAATMARFSRIDVLVNNAGITKDAQLVKLGDDGEVVPLSDEAFDAVIDVNLRAVFRCTRAVVPHMIEQKHGRILSASSVVGLYGNFGQTNYAATKFGVIGVTKVWARELGKHGITANAVAPGFIDTEMARAVPAKVLERMVGATPVRRLGDVRDVANAYVFLASDQASYINGTVLSVDGGLVVGT